MYIRWSVPLPGIPARIPTELRFFAVSQTFTVAHTTFFGTAPATPLGTSAATATSSTAEGTRRIRRPILETVSLGRATTRPAPS